MRIFCLFAALVLLAVGAWERHSVAGLRLENTALREQSEEGAALQEENRALAWRLELAGTGTSLGTKSELLRLRNEVRRLRSLAKDPGPLRAENARLAADLKAGVVRPPRLADEPGFLGRESWGPAGHATPEAVLQTACHAMREGNLDLLIETMMPREAQSMRRQVEQDPDARAEFSREARAHFVPTGFVIAGREEPREGTVLLRVRFTLSGAPDEMEFQRVGNTWKMARGF